ncbi:hypothetical protein JVU11DRAFT_11609 [Chiua virens]|nr:hypothetical protein JVU11DRAFT_11609 [Chiua virens]
MLLNAAKVQMKPIGSDMSTIPLTGRYGYDTCIQCSLMFDSGSQHSACKFWPAVWPMFVNVGGGFGVVSMFTISTRLAVVNPNDL